MLQCYKVIITTRIIISNCTAYIANVMLNFLSVNFKFRLTLWGDSKFCSVAGISVYVFMYSSHRNVILFEIFGRIHVYSGLYHVYHVYILQSS